MRDLRATLREFLTIKYGLTYDQCVQISEDFADYLVTMGESKLMITNDHEYQSWELISVFSPRNSSNE